MDFETAVYEDQRAVKIEEKARSTGRMPPLIVDSAFGFEWRMRGGPWRISLEDSEGDAGYFDLNSNLSFSILLLI